MIKFVTNNYSYLRNIPIIPLTRTQSSGPSRQRSFFCLFRDVTLSEIPLIESFTGENMFIIPTMKSLTWLSDMSAIHLEDAQGETPSMYL